MICSRRQRAHFPAPEARQGVAHGETVGLHAPTNPAPDGAKESSVCAFLPPLPGLEIAFTRFTHGGTVGYGLAPLRG
jgi:hypothetical protein